MDQNSQNNVLIDNSRTDLSTWILMPFLNSLHNIDANNIFLKGVDILR